MSGLVDGMVCPKLKATEKKVNALRETVVALECKIEELRAQAARLRLEQQCEKDAETHAGGGAGVPFFSNDESGVDRETIADDPELHGLTPAEYP
jgi:hypothetical protein